MKRLARLALMSGAETSVLLLNVIYNLMAIHPLTQTLIHREINRDTQGGMEEQKDKKSVSFLLFLGSLLLNTNIQIEKDPYQFEESDMHKCGAINSSLWEINVSQPPIASPYFFSRFSSNL